jgi:nitrite reductase/ring-hydroxylating ferredoxin subunit
MNTHIERKLDEIPQEIPVRLQHDGVAIIVVRTRSGVSAFYDRCPHAQWPLSDGEMIADVLVCPGHGWQFNMTTGQCLNSPVYQLKRLSVDVCNDSIRIEWD